MTQLRGLGDLANTFQLSRQISGLKAEIQRRSTELSTGTVADPGSALRGDYRGLAAIERRLSLAGPERLALSEAQGFAGAAQASLQTLHARAQDTISVLLGIPLAPTAPTLDRAGGTAREALEDAVAALNQRHAGRALFAGDAVDGPALAPASAMLDSLRAATATETTADGVVAAVDAWFDTPGGGFETTSYIGSPEPLAPFRLGEDGTVGASTVAADPVLRTTLKALALGALLDGPTLGSDVVEREALGRRAAEALIAATTPLVDLQARQGIAEERIAAASSRLSAESAALELARNDLLGADPFEAATRLETAQTQLETLFALTARVSRLSLTDFLR